MELGKNLKKRPIVKRIFGQRESYDWYANWADEDGMNFETFGFKEPKAIDKACNKCKSLLKERGGSCQVSEVSQGPYLR